MVNTSLKKLGFFSLPLPSHIWFLLLTPHPIIPLASSISCYLNSQLVSEELESTSVIYHFLLTCRKKWKAACTQ